jgi:hypothetical protein
LQVYDDFGKAGYSLTDYNEKWMTPNGLGEMAVEDTRSFGGGRFHVSAVPFQTGSDVGVDDHRKYLAVSTHTFPVPPGGALVLSADVKASTPGTVPGLTQLGVCGPSGSWVDPARPPARPQYTARRLQGQQAGVVSVSIPVGDASGRGAAGRARLFGQGAAGSFGNFTTLTITGPASRSDIVGALVAARS